MKFETICKINKKGYGCMVYLYIVFVGHELPCPSGETSETGFTPGCHCKLYRIMLSLSKIASFDDVFVLRIY